MSIVCKSVSFIVDTYQTRHCIGISVGIEGIEHLANALQHNRCEISPARLSCVCANYTIFRRPLTTLDLTMNCIGNEGVKHLAHASRRNTVKSVLYSSVLSISVSIQYRHLLR